MRSIVGKLIEGGTFYPTKQELVRAMVNASAPVPVVPETREHFWSTGDASTSVRVGVSSGYFALTVNSIAYFINHLALMVILDSSIRALLPQ